MLFILAGVALTPVSGRTVLVAESPHSPNQLSLQEALLDPSVTQIALSTDVSSTHIAEATPVFLTRYAKATSPVVCIFICSHHIIKGGSHRAGHVC